MTSDPIPTRLRHRLTAAPAGPSTAELILSDGARAGLARLSGGRALEELVVLTAAAALVVEAAERTGEPVLVVAGPDGPAACRLDVTAIGSVGDLVRAVDTALKSARAPQEGGLTVRSTRVESAPAELELVLGDGTLTGYSAHGAHEPWFLEVLLRAADVVLTAFADPSRALTDVPRAAEHDVAAAVELGGELVPGEPTTLVAPIEQNVREHPDRVAVTANGDRLTYAELWRAAGAIATRLVAEGVRPGDRVAVLTGKSIDAVPTLLGVLRARAAYVPLDVQSPDQRLNGMIADVGAVAALTTTGTAGRLEQAGVPVLLAAEAAAGETGELPEPGPDDLAYVIYTSGSTGSPKGVEVTHGAVAGYVRWKVSFAELDVDSRVLQLPSFAFDSSISDLFPALAAGGELVLADPHVTLPRELAALAREHAVTHATIVPSLYRLLLPELGADSGLRVVTVAGEATTADLVATHHDLLPGVRLVNEYGPTENSVCATAFDHGTNAGPGLPIGRPISTTVVRIGSPDGAGPAGFVGELLLTGTGLARGYHDRPELTAAVFPADAEGTRWYRTGDLGWWRPDGLVEFAGRADDQVKVRGHRVELGEVEAALTGLDGVAEAVVAMASGALVAFVRGGSETEEIAARLAERLPAAMLPSRYERVDTIPRLVSGKPDRARLAELAATEDGSVAAPSGNGDLVSVIAAIFQEVLGGAPFGPDDDFFLRGGHSLAAVSVIGKIEDRLGVYVDLGAFLEVATARELAGLVRDHRRGTGGDRDDTALWRLLDEGVESRG